MTTEKFFKACDVKRQIEDTQAILDRIHVLKEDDCILRASKEVGGIYFPVPDEIKNEIIGKVKSYYDSKIEKLKKEFEEL